MAGSFTGAIDAWVMESRARMEAVFKTAAQSVAEDVVDRTPVDTGFLRASLTASLVEAPAIRESARPAKDAKKGSFPTPANYSLVISNMKLGDTLYVGFLAAYAGHVEYGTRGKKGRGMVRLAAQAWPQHVAKAIREAKAAVKANAARARSPG